MANDSERGKAVYWLIDPIGWIFPALRKGPADAAPDAASRWVEVPGHGAMVADASVDLMGATCLRTNLVTKRALDAARPGTVVEIVSDNLSSVETIPFMLAGHGCVHLGTLHLDGFWKIYARKLGADEGEKGQ
jgi:TusA-related sulfurtransferase